MVRQPDHVPAVPERSSLPENSQLTFSTDIDFSGGMLREAALPRPIEPTLRERLANILKQHEYVSIQFPEEDGVRRTLHLTHPREREDLIGIHLVSEAVTEFGARLTSLDGRFFCNGQNGDVIHADEENVMSLEDALDRAESVLASRREKPLLLQLNPQGFVERSARLTLGITDTGGQNLYVEEMSAELARQGYRVMIVNRAGPSIMEYMGQLAAEAGDVPELEMERWKHRNDLRIGMHYCADGVDVLYIDDGFRVDEKRVFVAKEDMYDHEEFDPEQPSGPPRRRTHFRKLAEDLFQHTHDEPIVKVFSHYADGGAVGRLFKRIRNKAGLPEIPHIHIPHSTGHLKEAKFVSSGTSTEGLRLPARKQTEQAVYHAATRVLATSKDIEESIRSGYRGAQLGELYPGVNSDVYYPRDVSRTHPRYERIWNKLIERKFGTTDIKPVDRRLFQDSKIVLEISRTDVSKDKETVIRSFARAARLLDSDDAMGPFLVINISSSKEYPNLRKGLLRAIEDEGVKDRVLFFESFTNYDVADLYQISNLYFSASRMEGFGMSVQQAAACRLPIVSSTLIPFSKEVLAGNENSAVVTPTGRIVLRGPGALLFPPGDVEAAAYAVRVIIGRGINDDQLAQAAFDRTIPHYTWPHMLKRLMTEVGGMEYDENDRVIWPRP